MNELENLIEKYISPEKVMFNYDKEKKIELIYEKNKDKEENKIRNEILKNIIDLIEKDINGQNEIVIENNLYKMNNMRDSSNINNLGNKNWKYNKLIEVIVILKKYFYCNENMKRGFSINLLANILDEINISNLDLEYFKSIIFFFIKKIEDWHCISGVVKFFLTVFEKYKDILRNIKYSNEITVIYKNLFILKKKKKNYLIEERDNIKNYYFECHENGNQDNNSEHDLEIEKKIYEEEKYDDNEDYSDDEYEKEYENEDDIEDEDEDEDETKEENICVVYKILKHMFKHIHAPSYLQSIRINYYKIILISLQEFKKEISSISNFIDKIQVQLENESDPRNIMVLFDIIYTLCNKYISPIKNNDVININDNSSYDEKETSDIEDDDQNNKNNDISDDNNKKKKKKIFYLNENSLFTYEKEKNYLKSIIDIAFYYFPIEFIHNDTKYDSITEEDLQLSFFKCLKSNKRLGSYVIMNILDQFYNSENDELSEKNFKNIIKALEICIPYYGCLCSSKFITTVLGLIDLECIENNSTDKITNYFINILLIFINVLNKEKANIKYSLFNKYFISMFKKFQKYLILHKIMYEETMHNIFDTTELLNVQFNDHDFTFNHLYNNNTFSSSNKTVKKEEKYIIYEEKEKLFSDYATSVKQNNFISNDFYLNIANLSDSSSSCNSSDINDTLLNMPKNYEHNMNDSESSERNIFTIIKEKNEIEKIKEKKQKEKKKNKIKMDKFHVIEKILICISKGNSYIFLYILNTIIKPILKECYYLINILTDENICNKKYMKTNFDSNIKGNSSENISYENKEKVVDLKNYTDNDNTKNMFEEETRDNLNNKLIFFNNKEKDDYKMNTRIKKRWDLLIMYINLLNNILEKSVSIDEIISNDVCFIEEIYIIIEILKKGKSIFFDKYYDCGLHLFNILVNFICMHNIKDNIFHSNIYIFKTIFSFFYIIGIHPDNEKLKFFYECNNKLYEIKIDSYLYVDFWKNNIIKNYSNFINDIKNNNENIIKKNNDYKENCLFFFLILVNKLIKYKYEKIQNYINTILINLCSLVLRLHFCEYKYFNFYFDYLYKMYQIDAPYLLFLSTNLSSFILKYFFNYIEKIKDNYLYINDNLNISSGNDNISHYKSANENILNEKSKNDHVNIWNLYSSNNNDNNSNNNTNNDENMYNQNDINEENINNDDVGKNIYYNKNEDNICKLKNNNEKLKDMNYLSNEFSYDENCYVKNAKIIDELYLFVQEGKTPVYYLNKKNIKLGNTLNIKNLFFDKNEQVLHFDTNESNYIKENEEREDEKEYENVNEIEQEKEEENYIIINENLKHDEIIYFHFYFILNLLYVHIYYTYIKTRYSLANNGEFITNCSEEKLKNEYNYEKYINNSILKNEKMEILYDSFISVNNLEIFELCINYIYEEKIIKDIFLRKINLDGFNYSMKKDDYELVNLKNIKIINDKENIYYYAHYLNNLTNFVNINSINNLELNDVISKKLENDSNNNFKNKLIKFLKDKNFFINLMTLETDRFLHILKISLVINLMYERLDNYKNDNKNEDNGLLFVRYLYHKLKKNLNNIFIFLSKIKKKEFLENCIDHCLCNNKSINKNENDIFYIIFKDEYKNLNNIPFEFDSVNALLLLYIPSVLSIYSSISKSYIYKILKLCMYIFLYNIYSTNGFLNNIHNYINNDEKSEYNYESLHLLKEETFLNEYNFIMNYLNERSNIYFKNFSEIFNDKEIKKCLDIVDYINMKNMLNCSLQIMSIILHSSSCENEMINFVYIHFDLKNYFTICIKDALIFKNIIDHFINMYKSFINKVNKENDSLSFFNFLNKIYDVSFKNNEKENINKLFFLFDNLYFKNIEIKKYDNKGKSNSGKLHTNENMYKSSKYSKSINDIYIVDKHYLKSNIGIKKDSNYELEYNWDYLKKVDSFSLNNINLLNIKDLFSKNNDHSGKNNDDNFYFFCHFFFSLFQNFSVFYDLSFYIEENSVNYIEENVENLYDNLNNKLDDHVLILFYYSYISNIYNKIFSYLHNIDTNSLFHKENYNNIYFIQNNNFINLYKNILINFFYNIYNYLFFIDITNKYISVTEFIFIMNKENMFFKYSLPYDLIRKNEKTTKFIEKFILNYNIKSDENASNKESPNFFLTDTKEIDKQKNDLFLCKVGSVNENDIIKKDIINENICDSEKIKQNISNDAIIIEDQNECKLFKETLKERKKEKVNKYNCKYLSIIHLMTILLLNMPFEEVINDYYNILEICILKGINKVSNFFISKDSYLYNNKKYINEVLRKNINIVQCIFATDCRNQLNEKNTENKYKKILLRQVISLNIVLCLRLLYLINSLLNYYLKFKSKVDTNNGNTDNKSCLKENFHFLLSYKNVIIKSIMKILVSVPLALIRYLCVYIIYIISFFNYESFLSYSIIQDIKWYLSIASIDPHKKVRKMVVLCRARWM
ncbi:conserved Plasmodium membrane protein, unknown function [Plasmodium relictum]|uniref:MMS19 nucleotide excision repair protein n=1 Tax=Plasmodium relictum TaxID=85471 RepID=A0A1J1H7H8_PLARL|nr:conserved Plasmodium membrane protein, unknown function [Plasmodium relictum]CRH00619.1 conserved Plasmodium membrane protein, unknown function [Plasmodium relictum]